MTRHRSTLLLTLSLWLCCGCQQHSADTRAQDERAIRDADAATLKSAQAKDIDGAVANYADDASWLPPNSPMVTGKSQIRTGWARLINSPGFNIDWQINKLEIASAGDLAYTIYTYGLDLQGASGKPISDRGKDMAIWKKQLDGTWKMVADTFNSDLPLPAATKPPESKHRTIKHRPSRRHTSR
jgi:ketosteroid isomerase-like protein